MNLQAIYFLNNSLEQWLLALIWVVGALVAGYIIDRIIERILEPFLLSKTRLSKAVSDLVQTLLFIVFFLFGVRRALDTLTLSYSLATAIEAFEPVITGFVVLWLLIRLYKWITPDSTFQGIIINRIVPIVAVIVALFWLGRFWVTRPLRCIPNCAARSVLNADLRGITLREANLVDANLRGADLSDADLTGADLSGANLTTAILRNVNLTEAILIGADLTGADLRGAILEDTDFSGAVLNQTDLTKLDLTRANLKGVTLQQAKLVETLLAGVDLSGANLVQAILTGADMERVLLNGAHLTGVDLSDASLIHSEVTGALLNLATLTGADLREADLSGTSFIGSDLSSVDLNNSKLVGATLIGANLGGASFRAADLTGTRLLQGEILESDIRIDSVLFELNELQLELLITDANLQGVTFDDATVWPDGKDAFLATLLGSEATDNTTASEEGENLGSVAEPDFLIVGQADSVSLQRAVIELITNSNLTGTVGFNGTSVTTGIQLLCADQSVIFVVANRSVLDSERAACEAQEQFLLEVLVALEAIVPIVSSQNEFAEQLSAEQVQQLLTAERWVDVNPLWPSEPIRRLLPTTDSATVEMLNEWAYPDAEGSLENIEGTTFEGNFMQVVQELSNDRLGVAFVSYSTFLQNGETLRLLEIDDMPLSAETVASGEYSLVQPINLIVRRRDVQEFRPVADYLNRYTQVVSTVTEETGYFNVDAELLARIQGALLQAEDGELALADSIIETVAIAADVTVSSTAAITTTANLSTTVAVTPSLGTLAPESSIVAVGEGAAATLLLTAYGRYVEQTEEVALLIEPASASDGLRRLCTDHSADLVLLSDLAALEDSTGCVADSLLAIPAGSDALALVIHPNNSFAANLTRGEVAALLFAESWSEVDPNWPETELTKLVADNSLLPAFVDSLAQGDPNLALSLRASDVDKAQGFAALIDSVAGNPNAVALISYARLQPYLDDVRLVRIDNTLPSAATVADGSYPFVRSLFFYTLFETLAERPVVREFLLYYLSDLAGVVQSADYMLPASSVIERAQARIETIAPTE